MWYQFRFFLSEETEFTKCLKNLNEQLPEICQTKIGDEEKCQEWLKQNKDTFQNMLDPCTEQL